MSYPRGESRPVGIGQVCTAQASEGRQLLGKLRLLRVRGRGLSSDDGAKLHGVNTAQRLVPIT